VNYNKIVTLYYSNGAGVVTPLSVITFGYTSDTANHYEIWSANTPDVYLDGITQLLNITYQALDVGKVFVQVLNINVVATGAAPTTTAPPVPYATPRGFANDITQWLAARQGSEAAIAKTLMFDNINIPGAAPGTVIAAQSYTAPDYAYNWVRDSSLTMDVVQSFYAAGTGSHKATYESILFQYAQARYQEQVDPGLQTGLGEPKFFLNNSIFTGPWGRPQNDGPATSAITLMEFSSDYLAAGGSLATIRQAIYDGPQAPVLRDLLFVANNWTYPSFDIWEEEPSDHFYNRMVQHRAMLMGSTFALQFNDAATSQTLSAAATAIAATLGQFWDPIRNLILYEYGPVLRGKYSYKDVAVVLGVIHGYAGDGIYSYTNDQVLETAWQIATSFIPVFPIAATHFDAQGRPLGTPIGRYPEDVYNGVDTSLGNPWYLCTASMAELFYRASTAFNKAGSITVTETSLPFWQYFAPGLTYTCGTTYNLGRGNNYGWGWVSPNGNTQQGNAMVASMQGWADAFMRTVKYYTPAGGHLSEEVNRTTGVAQGAKDLTWSYAALLTAAFARAEAGGAPVGYSNYVRILANM